MKKYRGSTALNRLSLTLSAFLVAPAVTAAAADDSGFEVASDLRASAVLPSELLRGDHFSVDETVVSDGYLNYYRIKSDYGEFEAAGSAMLRIRIGEIAALGALDELSRTEVFIEAAADAGMGQIRALSQFATRPVETLAAVPAGIGRMFKRYSRQAGEAVDSVRDFVADDGDEEVQAAAADGVESTTDKAMDLTESVMGVSGAQRNWARKLGTDPYTSNQVLKAAIREVAWAERLGSFGMGFAGLPSIPGADIIGEVNDIVWSKDPYELADLNRSRLLATGASEKDIEDFLNAPNMTPTAKTMLVAAISELADAAGRDGILRQAMNVRTEAEAYFFLNSVVMLAWYHLNEAAIQTVLTYAAVPVGVVSDELTVLLFAADHVFWTESVAEAAARHAERLAPGVRGEVWLQGTISATAKAELNRIGLSVRDRVGALIDDRPRAAERAIDDEADSSINGK